MALLASVGARSHSATVTLHGKSVQVHWTAAAPRALQARVEPLVLELDLDTAVAWRLAPKRVWLDHVRGRWQAEFTM